MRGLVALWRGQITDAVRWLDEAAALSGTPESRFRRIIPWSHLAQARALAGDAAGAAAASAEATAAAAMFPLGAGYAGEAGAWARAAGGDATGAARDAAAGARSCADRGLRTIALWCAHDALRLAPGPAPAALVTEIAAGFDGRWAAAFRTHATAVADRDADGLLTAADAFEEIGARLHAAEVLDLAAGWLHAEGRRDGARRARARADEAFAACPGAVRRTLPAALDDPAVASLSRREREVAVLAAAGLANATIAERLGLSVRTTEGHLARAMAKLDVARRTELGPRLGDLEHA
jgi:DNA-binding CsgD family transcriptional regulator